MVERLARVTSLIAGLNVGVKLVPSQVMATWPGAGAGRHLREALTTQVFP